jgi:Fe-S cluster assembly protein SufD
MLKISRFENQYISFYQKFSENIKQNSAECLNIFRDEYFDEFVKFGFPAKKNEEYRYSNISNTLEKDYGLNINRLKFQIDKNLLFHCKISSINAVTGFMINDNFYLPDNQKNMLPKGVVFCSISEAEKLYPEIIKKYLFSQSKNSRDGFAAFNSAFVQDGYFLYIQQDTILSQPLQLINLLRSANPLLTFTKNLIVVEKNAQAKMLVCNHTADTSDFFASRLTEMVIDENAQFDYCTLENTGVKTNSVSHIFANQKDNSILKINQIGLNNAVVRNNFEVNINGQGAELFLGGMLISDGTQETENFTLIRHNQPNSTSNELFKYILDDTSHGIFSGRIIVEKDAQKTYAKQTNKNICLTNNALMHARPQLEIYADDVKCGHGATTGQIDNEAIFYLRARGIDEKTARRMLLAAFTADVIEQVKIDVLRERLTLMVEKRLNGDNSHCPSCFMC